MAEISATTPTMRSIKEQSCSNGQTSQQVTPQELSLLDTLQILRAK